MAVSRLGQRIYKNSLDRLVVPERRELFKKMIQWGYVKETQEPTERVHNGQSSNDLSSKIMRYWVITQSIK